MATTNMNTYVSQYPQVFIPYRNEFAINCTVTVAGIMLEFGGGNGFSGSGGQDTSMLSNPSAGATVSTTLDPTLTASTSSLASLCSSHSSSSSSSSSSSTVSTITSKRSASNCKTWFILWESIERIDRCERFWNSRWVVHPPMMVSPDGSVPGGQRVISTPLCIRFKHNRHNHRRGHLSKYFNNNDNNQQQQQTHVANLVNFHFSKNKMKIHFRDKDAFLLEMLRVKLLIKAGDHCYLPRDLHWFVERGWFGTATTITTTTTTHDDEMEQQRRRQQQQLAALPSPPPLASKMMMKTYVQQIKV